jgi:hypothetical protein
MFKDSDPARRRDPNHQSVRADVVRRAPAVATTSYPLEVAATIVPKAGADRTTHELRDFVDARAAAAAP